MTNKIKVLVGRIKKSKDGRTLANNFGYLMLLQIAGYVFPLITIPYLARVIGVEGFGKIAFAAAVVMWFRTVAEWGFNYTATRDVARNRDDLEKVSKIFSNVLWARLLLTLLSFFILIMVVISIPHFKENQKLLLITFLLVPGHIFFPDWFFQAMEKMKYITIFDFFSKALFTIFVFVFINDKSDFILQPLFMSLGYVLSGLVAMYIVLVKWKIKIYAPNCNEIYSTIRNSTNVFINNIMPNMFNTFSIVLLGFFGGSVSNGLLDAGSKFVNLSIQFMTVVSRVFFPYLSRKTDKHSIYMKINLIVAVFFSVVLFFSAPLLIKIFYTPEFAKAILVLKIMSLSIVFIALNNIYGVNYMIINGHEKQLKNITIICSLIGFLLSIPLVYFYDYIGAAITISFTRCIMGFSVSYNAIRLMDRKHV